VDVGVLVGEPVDVGVLVGEPVDVGVLVGEPPVDVADGLAAGEPLGVGQTGVTVLGYGAADGTGLRVEPDVT
jgi:hypothetical protein